MNNEHAGPIRNRQSLFWQVWLRSVTVRRPQAALAIGSLLVGAAVASMLLNLYRDVRRKMTEEFRAYGANVVLASATDAANSSDLPGVMEGEVMGRLEPIERRVKGLAAAPVLSVVMRLKRLPPDPRLPEFENVVAVGTDFASLRRLYPGWRIEGAASTLEPGICALGAHLAARLRLRVGEAVELATIQPANGQEQAEAQVFRIGSVLSTGASEDDQVFISLPSLQRLSGFEGRISLVELSVPGETAEIERMVSELSQAFPGLEVRPLRQIIYSEGMVLGTIRWLLVSLTALILITIALCLTATMTAILLERRKDIAVMKALGASDYQVMQLFLSEGAVLGLAGGIAGFGLGGLLARHLALRLFDVTLNLTWWTFPLICISSMLLAALATLFPVKMIRGVQPAEVLKGE